MLDSHLMLLCSALPPGEQCTYLACVITDLPMHSPATTEEPYNQAK